MAHPLPSTNYVAHSLPSTNYVAHAGKQGKLLIPDDEVAKVLKTKILGPTGMKGLAAIKNIVEKWSAVLNTMRCPLGLRSLSVLLLL